MKRTHLTTAMALCLAILGLQMTGAFADVGLTKGRIQSRTSVRQLSQNAKNRTAHEASDHHMSTFSAGMPAPSMHSMRTVSATGANLFGAIPGEGKFVSISTGDNIALNELYSNSSYLNPTGGATYIGNNKYIAAEFDDSFAWLTATYVTIFSFDGTEFKNQSSVTMMDEEAWYASDMTYDPNSETIYGYFTLNDDSSSFFGKLDSKYNPQRISTADKWTAVACSGAGLLYGINNEGALCNIDKGTGSATKIGSTGFTPGSTNSASFGADGKLYWTSYTAADGCRLYQVDTASGVASLVGAIPDGKAIAGLCSYGSNAEPATPCAAVNPEMIFAEGALSGIIRFGIAETLADGTPGSGKAKWSVSIGGVAIQTGEADFGATIEAPVSVTQAGDYTFTISISNEAGSAPDTTVSGWIGEDNRTVLTPAFNYTFETEDRLDGFTIINANKDNKQWAWYSGRVRIVYNSSKAMDDWIITPPVMLEAGKLYELNSLFSCYADSEERIEVKLGTSPTVEAMTTTVIDKTTLKTEYNKPDTFTGKIKVETTGKYYIGFHGCSDEDMNTLFLHSFSIDEGKSAAAPGAPTNLTVTPADDYSLKATISCNVPAVDINGNAVTSLTKLEILRDNVLIHTVTPVEPNQLVSHIDNSSELTHGTYTYSVRAYNEAGAGEMAQASAYIGVQVPVAPASATCRQTSPGIVTVTWDAVTTDEDGKTISPDKISYALICVVDNKSTIIKEGLTDTSYTYTVCSPEDEQNLYYYGVRAVTDAGFSPATLTDMIPVGKSFTVPFKESFPGGIVTYVWGTKRITGVQSSWGISQSQASLAAQDNDNGFAVMTGTAANDEAILSSGNISLEGTNSPELSYWYYSLDPECGNTLDLLLDDGSGSFRSVRSDVAGGGAAGWRKATFDLKQYVGKTIRIAFDAKIKTHTIVALDNIAIREAHDHNLTIAYFNVPAEIEPDVEYSLPMTIVNNGRQKATGWTAILSLNGEQVETVNGSTLEADESKTIGFKVMHNVTSEPELSYSVRVDYDKDSDLSDNVCEAPKSALKLNDYPAPENLTAVGDGPNVRLTWNEPQPATDMFNEESFEDWAHLDKEPKNDWTFRNVDTGLAGGFKNVPLTGIDDNAVGFFAIDCSTEVFQGNPTFAAHSGKKYMASMYSYNPSTNSAVANDDWMITPQLDGSAQTVTFYAKSYSAEYPESFEALYSTTNTETSSFTLLERQANVPGDWTPYSFNVPEGAKFFAIRCTSRDCFLFMVDDVRFKSKDGVSLNVSGYNVYRDGKRVNTQPVTELSFIDNGAASQNHTYHVSSLYDNVESKPVMAHYATSGIGNVDADGINIYAAHEQIVISGARGEQVSIVSTDGQTVFSSPVSDHCRISVAPGIYMVKCAHIVRKILVP